MRFGRVCCTMKCEINSDGLGTASQPCAPAADIAARTHTHLCVLALDRHADGKGVGPGRNPLVVMRIQEATLREAVRNQPAPPARSSLGLEG
jgi:hypothetical protein